MQSTVRSILFLLSLMMCLTSPRYAAAQMESFLCDGAIAFNALFAPNGESIMIEFSGQQKVLMTQAVSGSGTRYVGGGYELHGKGNSWVLTRPGGTTVNCASATTGQPQQNINTAPPVNTQPPPQPAVAVRFPFAAHSFGGIVRSGPNLNNRKIYSLQEGDPITLLENTGRHMDGYDWFRIRHRGGIGYQWGGILCSDGVKIIGVLSQCPYFRNTAPRPQVKPKKPRCKKGQYWSVSRKRCQWYSKAKKKKRGCPPGTVWSAEGNMCRNKMAEFCGPGYHWNNGLKKCQPNQ